MLEFGENNHWEVIKLKIKELAAATIAAGFLALTPAFAAGPGVTDHEMLGREKQEQQEEQQPENREFEKKDRYPENEDLNKKDRRKRDERHGKKGYEEFVKDPLGTLENRKSEIQKLLKEGKIPKEKAEAIIKKIDAGIAEVKEFNGLTLEQKRKKLLKDCRDYLDSLVEKGELEREEADRIYKEYADKIGKWDGTGYPKFLRKCPMPKKH